MAIGQRRNVHSSVTFRKRVSAGLAIGGDAGAGCAVIDCVKNRAATVKVTAVRRLIHFDIVLFPRVTESYPLHETVLNYVISCVPDL